MLKCASFFFADNWTNRRSKNYNSQSIDVGAYKSNSLERCEIYPFSMELAVYTMAKLPNNSWISVISKQCRPMYYRQGTLQISLHRYIESECIEN